MISLDSEVYDGLVRLVGKSRIGWFLEELARPYVDVDSLRTAYAAMAMDTDREDEALAFSEGLIGDVDHSSR